MGKELPMAKKFGKILLLTAAASAAGAAVYYYMQKRDRELLEYEDEDFSVLLGMELRHYATANDYLVYGVEPDWLRQQGNLLALSERKMYRLMHQEGHLVYQAHPFRPFIRRCNPKYVDGIEIYNGKTDRMRNYKALNWAAKHRKLTISGSDFHKENHLARGGIITETKITNNRELLSVLQSQKFEIIKTY